mmetsp:Transcript_36000/g.59640  ORF Transcript_36000/g.59640 Transcript_36000/m.59640 type:complete len:215 (-) Transcript_36000:152-796(-)
MASIGPIVRTIVTPFVKSFFTFLTASYISARAISPFPSASMKAMPSLKFSFTAVRATSAVRIGIGKLSCKTSSAWSNFSPSNASFISASCSLSSASPSKMSKTALVTFLSSPFVFMRTSASLTHTSSSLVRPLELSASRSLKRVGAAPLAAFTIFSMSFSSPFSSPPALLPAPTAAKASMIEDTSVITTCPSLFWSKTLISVSSNGGGSGVPPC